ncbi:hypothetical protein EUGRSUZ_H03115 [Eucalyptus grandis]|uniref:Uncharacterized protein n=2 Tax=Eucalyptus grandis TaxID=71139 RepID=A0ACC3JTX0_EUCGR|nr:hypothetical protein EUGRSUZ_H03115 [Eucalyptus grandis]
MLLDAEKKQWDSEQVKLWLMRLKDVLYDAQDLLDDVATEDLRQKVTPGNKMSEEVRSFFSKSNQLAQPYKVAKRMQEIRKKLDWIAKDREFRLEEHRSEATSVSVVPIVGMGGLGKTTLARLAYNDDKVRNYFELKMWACVSDVFDLDFLIKEILKSARDKYKGNPENLRDIDNKCKDELLGLLRKVLDGKKYLLVLDDLWNEDHGKWSELQRLLMGGSLGSKILVTTRNRSVVDAIGTKSDIHYLDFLSKDELWDLFKKTAFGDGEKSLNQELEQIGQDIVEKCGGVPLAIKTIGNLLYAKKEKEWLYLKGHEFSKIDTLNSGIMEVLKISYNHLQPGLKHCFAYYMIQFWMAQGFIESLDGNEKLEEIGDSYVWDLLYRSFLEVEEVDPYMGEVKKFKMHDLMHDLALKVTGNECKMVSLNKGSLDEDTRHASFALQSFSSLQELKHLRFLDIFKNDSIKSLPDPITDLLNLQTLKISTCEKLKTLPKDLRKLWLQHAMTLQSLDISYCQNLRNLPEWIKNFSLLEEFVIHDCPYLPFEIA